MSQLLLDAVSEAFSTKLDAAYLATDGVVTIEVAAEQLINVAQRLYDEPAFDFKMLVDLCGIDYIEYGQAEWRTTETTYSGFSRGKEYPEKENLVTWQKPRFAVLYNLLSLKCNHRLRLRVFLHENKLKLPSVDTIWNSANWFEREAFDLFGIVFEGHPDLRRILTDYGFVGHPFRKDFPLIGAVELRYDAQEQRCLYEPVSIQPRVTVPRVIRDDTRYYSEETPAPEGKK